MNNALRLEGLPGSRCGGHCTLGLPHYVEMRKLCPSLQLYHRERHLYTLTGNRVRLRASLDDTEKGEFLTLPGFEFRPSVVHPAAYH
jgi:hypothetical protein